MRTKNIDTSRVRSGIAYLKERTNEKDSSYNRILQSGRDMRTSWHGSSSDAFGRFMDYVDNTKTENNTLQHLRLDETEEYTFYIDDFDLQYAEHLSGFGSGSALGISAASVTGASMAAMVGAGVDPGAFHASDGLDGYTPESLFETITGEAWRGSDWQRKYQTFRDELYNTAVPQLLEQGYTIEGIRGIYQEMKNSGVTKTHLMDCEKGTKLELSQIFIGYAGLISVADKALYTNIVKGGEYFTQAGADKWSGCLYDSATSKAPAYTAAYRQGLINDIGGYYRDMYNKWPDTEDPASHTTVTGAPAYNDECSMFKPQEGKTDVDIGKQKDIDTVIKCFEGFRPADGQKIDRLFEKVNKDGIYDQDIRNIKYLTYTADERYRDVFLQYIDEIKIKETEYDEKKAQHYLSLGLTLDYGLTVNGLFLNLSGAKDGINDPRGPYTTFFHECAHGIDDVSKLFGNQTSKYRYASEETGEKMSLREYASMDCEKKILTKIDYYNRKVNGVLTDDQKTAILHSLMWEKQTLPERVNGITLDSDSQKILKDIENDICFAIGSEKYECPSDILGGLTENQLRGLFYNQDDNGNLWYSGGHDIDYWRTDYKEYGENPAGQSEIFYREYYDNENIQKEFFAEYFSYHMTGDAPAISAVQDYFPNTSKAMDEMIQDEECWK